MNTIIKSQDSIGFSKHPSHREVYTKVMSTSDENGRFSSHVIVVKPGGEILPHTHEVVEVFYIIKGKGIAFANNNKTKVTCGTVITASVGDVHGLLNDSDNDLELYAVFSPGIA